MEDIFEDLSDDCKKLGYCQLEVERNNFKRTFIDDAAILKMVPYGVLQYTFNHLGAFVKGNMKVALEAFHQDDFETAIIYSKVVLDENRDRPDALICVAVSEYFSGNYFTAIEYAARCMMQDRAPASNTQIDDFIAKCNYKIEHQTRQETSSNELSELVLPTAEGLEEMLDTFLCASV